MKSCRLFSVFLLAVAVQFAWSSELGLPLGANLDFNPGDSWTWAYRKVGSNETYSAEKYEVLSVEKTILENFVTFSMSTSYNGGPFELHHKFVVDTNRCRKAHRHPQVKYKFLIKLFPYRDGEFQTPIKTKALAFEEKFNCNWRVYEEGHFKYLTEFQVVRTLDGREFDTFKQINLLKPSDQINGRYDLNTGVLVQKVFNEESADAFVSELQN